MAMNKESEWEMTNIVGMVLMVLSVKTNTVMATNQVGITCAEAGCTNKPCCVYCHYREEVVPVVEITEIVIGTADVKPTHLYRIIKQRVIGNNGWAGNLHYMDGMYISEPEKKARGK